MLDYLKLVFFGVVVVCAAIAANYARDAAYLVHMLLFMAVGGGLFLYTLRRMGEPAAPVPTHEYMDGPVRAAAIATAFWGVVGFLVGVTIAFQLAFPVLNFEWAQGYLNFGRLRPLHTSAVIFAFGGNALLAASFYIVQRTSAARMWGGNLTWFVFWGYQMFIVMAATGYLLGSTQGQEYAEPEWLTDLWLTIVWVAFLAVYVGTLLKRKEPHIYVANWFLLSFIVTVAMLHVVNNLQIPVSIFGSSSVVVMSGVQDAMTQWWYGHNAVGFFLTAGFLGMMYYFIPKQAERPVYSYKLSIIHFWALIFLYIWAGPHHLHYTALPDWASTLGMVFSVVLWMPSWGGMINGLMTLSGAWDKLRTDPVIADDGDLGRVLRHVDLRRPDDVDPRGELAVALHRLDDRSRALRCAGLERHDHLRDALLPVPETVEPPVAVQPEGRVLALLARHHRHRALRRVHVGHRYHGRPDVARSRRARASS
jgi:cytochrome c oxidase cbb3-type subunit 1